MKKFFKLKIAAVAAAMMLMMFVFAACAGNGDANDNGDMNNANGEDQQVAGAEEEVVYGYILEVNAQAKTILVDGFRLVSAVDTAARADMGLTDDSTFYNGYYISNSGARLLYPLANDVELTLADMNYAGNSYYLDRYGLKDEMSNLDAQNAAEDNSVNIGDEDNEDENYMHNQYSADNDGTSLMELDQQAREGLDPVLDIFPDDADDSANTSANENNDANGIVDMIDDMTNDMTNGMTNGNTENMSGNNGANSGEAAYMGNDLARLSARIETAQYIPFRIFLEHGKVVRIMEMDSLYR